MATQEITMKLTIDTKSNKVIFAEASKDFVDLLFFLLSLPIGAAIKLFTSEFKAGSIRNLYTNVTNIYQTTLQPDIRINYLINPVLKAALNTTPDMFITQPCSFSGKFYTCDIDPHRLNINYLCKTAMSTQYNVDRCPGCLKTMCSVISLLGSSETYVPMKEVVSYMISDDLSVTRMSTMSVISMISKSNMYQLEMLEERKVKVGVEEGLELLRNSFHSKTVLTDVFLLKKDVKVEI